VAYPLRLNATEHNAHYRTRPTRPDTKANRSDGYRLFWQCPTRYGQAYQRRREGFTFGHRIGLGPGLDGGRRCKHVFRLRA
jgi:hypothetical protein